MRQRPRRGAMPFIARNTIDTAHNPAYAAGYLYNQVKPRLAMATHVSYDEYVIPELVAEIRTHWNGPFAFGAPDMVVVNMTKDRIWVRDGVARTSRSSPWRCGDPCRSVLPEGLSARHAAVLAVGQADLSPGMVPEQMKKKPKAAQ